MRNYRKTTMRKHTLFSENIRTTIKPTKLYTEEKNEYQ